MKRLLAIFSLLTFLHAHMAFGEVLKLPMLVQHYLEHIDEDKDITVFQFFVQHYTEGIDHNHQENHNHHDKLPFKTTDGHFSSVVSMVSPPFVMVSHHTVAAAALRMPAYHQQDYSNAYLNSIWQPPRFS